MFFCCQNSDGQNSAKDEAPFFQYPILSAVEASHRLLLNIFNRCLYDIHGISPLKYVPPSFNSTLLKGTVCTIGVSCTTRLRREACSFLLFSFDFSCGYIPCDNLSGTPTSGLHPSLTRSLTLTYIRTLTSEAATGNSCTDLRRCQLHQYLRRLYNRVPKGYLRLFHWPAFPSCSKLRDNHARNRMFSFHVRH